jgi:hypothetical protein
MDYREELARKQWREKEKERMLQWEREQAEKDKEDAVEREKRQTLLDEKKRKLQELKQSQQLMEQSNAESLQSQQQKAQEEANKLSKQLRIQNKAKFVTKKLKTGVSADEAVQQANAQPGTGSSTAAQAAASHLNTANNSSVNLLAHVGSMPQLLQQPPKAVDILPLAALLNNDLLPTVAATDTRAEEPEQTIPAEFLEKVAQLQTEIDVKALQKQLMGEKRSLRLQQQQNISADPTEGELFMSHVVVFGKRLTVCVDVVVIQSERFEPSWPC